MRRKNGRKMHIGSIPGLPGAGKGPDAGKTGGGAPGKIQQGSS